MAIIAKERGGNSTWECDDCGRWEYQSRERDIRHSSRCGCSEAQPSTAETQEPHEETPAQREARIRRGDWETVAEVYNEFGDRELAGRVLLDTDY